MTEEHQSERTRRTFMKGAAATGVATTSITAFGGAASAQEGVVIEEVTQQEGLINVVLDLTAVLQNITVNVDIQDVEVNVLNIDITNNIITIDIDVLSNVPDGSLLTVVVEGVNDAGQTASYTATQRL